MTNLTKVPGKDFKRTMKVAELALMYGSLQDSFGSTDSSPKRTCGLSAKERIAFKEALQSLTEAIGAAH